MVDKCCYTQKKALPKKCKNDLLIKINNYLFLGNVLP